MTGLEKIVNQINADADATCSRISDKCSEKCRDIEETARQNAADIKAKGDSEAIEKYKTIIARAHSSAEIEERKILLTARQKAVSDTVFKAREYLLNLSHECYFDLIYKLISAHSLEGEGVIRFNQKDLSRLPEDFLSSANSVAKGTLSLSDKSVAIDGGFILVYGGIDVNCSLESLFSSNEERISDAVAKILFE